MAAVVAEFFQVIGVDMTPPTNMVELIPYLLTVVVGVFLVAQVFRVISAIAYSLVNARRF
jgi:hypothetical protein